MFAALLSIAQLIHSESGENRHDSLHRPIENTTDIWTRKKRTQAIPKRDLGTTLIDGKRTIE